MIVNLYGPPSAGKSVTRADVFRILKQEGVNCEEVIEVAKKMVWEKRQVTLKCQPYIFGKQLRDMEILTGQVDVIITDSPLLLSRYYSKKYGNYPESFYQSMVDIALSMPSMNYFIKRTAPYNPVGRNQTEAEANEIAVELQAMLDELGVAYTLINGDKQAGAQIAHDIMQTMGLWN